MPRGAAPRPPVVNLRSSDFVVRSFGVLRITPLLTRALGAGNEPVVAHGVLDCRTAAAVRLWGGNRDEPRASGDGAVVRRVHVGDLQMEIAGHGRQPRLTQLQR